MSDRMRPIPFSCLIDWILAELKKNGSVFGIKQAKFYKPKVNVPIGPAAGPHTQLSQNIIASYLTGARFIELKTVQIIDGEDLPVEKPCIEATDEGYNVEWSTELRVEEAFSEYVKAWFLLHVLEKELNLSDKRDFTFNLSVGYDLTGIQSPKINQFIDGLKQAETTEIWKECYQYLKAHIQKFTCFTLADLENIQPEVCSSITLSTLHGTKPEEIERIVDYLLKEKHLNTYIKLNPTLLGESFVRETLNTTGYGYIELNSHHFENDLQFNDAIAMITRLKEEAKKLGLFIGVKLSNTLPVKILKSELPGEEMYMSGRSLYPLTINLASRLADVFEGDLQISYSGGIDYFNIDKVYACGIKPVTFATTLLKPGGYLRIKQMAERLEKVTSNNIIDLPALKALASSSGTDQKHMKAYRPVKSRKLTQKLPVYDCAVSPCSVGCPVNQEIAKYIALVGEKRYAEALNVIVRDNSAPSVTGSICNHECEIKCTRLDYDEPVNIRGMKKIAVDGAMDEYLDAIKPTPLRSDKKALVIGAGPAGLASAYFLRRNGIEVTVFEKREKPFGMVQYVIPEFRIAPKDIDRDYLLVKRQGVQFKFGVNPDFNLDELKKHYDFIILGLGAWKAKTVPLKAGSDPVITALEFLEAYKANCGNMALGKEVAVIGGGDVAMDAARSAGRVSGVDHVSIIYRRTRDLMPASMEESEVALREGIEIKELLTPAAYKNGILECEQMILDEPDESGRRKPVPSGASIQLKADSVIVASGEETDAAILLKNGIALNSRGLPATNDSLESNLAGVYLAGDMVKGAATVVKAIADGKTVAQAILKSLGLSADFEKAKYNINEALTYEKHGLLSDILKGEAEAGRCLSCGFICETCVDVCPNRANQVISVNGKHQIIHIDGMCNECGNCADFCPYDGKPYKDKITVFWNEADFNDSTNTGFLVTDEEYILVRENKRILKYFEDKELISGELTDLIETIIHQYSYVLRR